MNVWTIASYGIAAIIITLGIVLLWKIRRDKMTGFPSQDERTQKINGKAASYALYIGQYFTLALLGITFMSQELYGSPAFEAGYALIASLLSYSISLLGLRWYFNRKGDF